MPCLHGVLKIAFIVVFGTQDTDPALCQKGIAVFRVLFGNHCDFHAFRQLQRTEQPGRPCAYDYNICFFFHIPTCVFLFHLKFGHPKGSRRLKRGNHKFWSPAHALRFSLLD